MDTHTLRRQGPAAPGHTPVLLEAVLHATAPRPGDAVIDCTLGMGGYARQFLDATAPDGRLLGIDRDAETLELAKAELAQYGQRFQGVHASFATLASVAKDFPRPNSIVADLGLSSVALDAPARGFSFLQDGPLDMRMDQSQGQTAADLVNHMSERELETLLKKFGEEPHSRAIAQAVVVKRDQQPLTRTSELVQLIDDTYRSILRAPAGRKLWLQRGLHPATRTFQALRIAVNDELGQVAALLPQAFELLAPGGRLAIVSFHSLEDRLVKQYFQQLAKRCSCPPEQLQCTCDRIPAAELLTRKPLSPSPQEIQHNPRARSGKLRALKKL